MLKYLEMTGKTEEEAVEKALAQLGLDRDDVSVELLERAKSGFLGLGSSPARIRVQYEAPDETPAAAPAEAQAAVTAEAEAPRAEEAPAPQQPAEEKAVPAADLSGDEKAEKIYAFLKGLLEHLDSTAEPHIALDEEGHYKVTLEGERLGQLIGRRGETLDAIQQLTSYSVNRGQSKRVRIHVDAEGYRAKREESLQRLAVKVAGKVVKYRKNMTLEPMNAYERHVIHAALQDYPNVTTYSTGVEPNRRTVVAYAPGQK